MSNASKFKLIAVIALLAGPIMAFMGYQDQQRLAALEKDGVTVPGFIEGGEWKRGKKGSKSYSFDVSYTPQSGAPQKQSFKINSDFFKAHATEQEVTDPNCQVRYLASDPKNAIVIGGSTDITALFGVGIGAAVIGLLGCGYLFFMYKPADA